MRSIFLKIFLSFWLAEMLSMYATMWMLRKHFDGPEVQHRSLFSTMILSGNQAAREYETGGCPALNKFLAASPQPAHLVTADGRLLCSQNPQPEGIGEILRDLRRHEYPLAGFQIGNHYIWGTEVHAPSGQTNIFVINCVYNPPPFSFRIWWPRMWVGFAISGVVVFFLAFVLTRPIERLRNAARRMAKGELSARAGKGSGKGPSSRGSDEIGALVQDFDHMAERLESLVAAQRLLLRDVSHELRSPLARLSVALELARDEAVPEMETHLDRMERETSNLNQLIGQLLSLSQMESAQRIADLQSVDLRPLLEHLAADASYEAQSRHCTVQLACHADCTVKANPELLHRAVENIVRNALQYTADETAVEITLDCETSAGDREAVVRVMDHGSGIAPEKLEAIFQPFYRLDHARERATGGFGVGLAIADRAIRLHSGRIRAANRQEGGLMVEIRIPCQKSAVR
jgi:two-component system sensor histidine kinase CpxA